jgi:hypothetical protein
MPGQPRPRLFDWQMTREGIEQIPDAEHEGRSPFHQSIALREFRTR